MSNQIEFINDYEEDIDISCIWMGELQNFE